MAVQGYRVGRREMWRARLHGWRQRLRRPTVWAQLLAGLAILAGAVWWWADNTAFARRAVTATAVIERVDAPVALPNANGPAHLVVYGTLSYQIDGGRTLVRTRATLAVCTGGPCVDAARNRPGRSLRIAYDPENVTRVYLGPKVPMPLDPGMLVFVGLGVIFIAGGLYTLFFDLGIPVAKPNDQRPAA